MIYFNNETKGIKKGLWRLSQSSSPNQISDNDGPIEWQTHTLRKVCIPGMFFFHTAAANKETQISMHQSKSLNSANHGLIWLYKLNCRRTNDRVFRKRHNTGRESIRTPDTILTFNVNTIDFHRASISGFLGVRFPGRTTSNAKV